MSESRRPSCPVLGLVYLWAVGWLVVDLLLAVWTLVLGLLPVTSLGPLLSIGHLFGELG